jgi:hypothetical protein
MRDVNQELKSMSIDELRIFAKRLGLSGYSSLRKTDLIKHIGASDSTALQNHLFPTWWQTYHNHVYGFVSVFGLLLSIVFFAWPGGTDSNNRLSPHQSLSIRTVEKPIAFADYATMPPAEKESLFKRRNGERFIWEGFLSNVTGFKLGSPEGVPYDSPVSIHIKPLRSSSPQILAECQFGEIGGGDSGALLSVQLSTLTIGQRIRISGTLGKV